MTNKMWGGRFKAGPSEIMEEINASIGFDRRLANQDIAGSKAHVDMLAAKGIVSKSDCRTIKRGLDQIRPDETSPPGHQIQRHDYLLPTPT